MLKVLEQTNKNINISLERARKFNYFNFLGKRRCFLLLYEKSPKIDYFLQIFPCVSLNIKKRNVGTAIDDIITNSYLSSKNWYN